MYSVNGMHVAWLGCRAALPKHTDRVDEAVKTSGELSNFFWQEGTLTARYLGLRRNYCAFPIGGRENGSRDAGIANNYLLHTGGNGFAGT